MYWSTPPGGIRPRPHVSGDFCIRKFFYPDTKISASTRSVYESYTSVHTYPIRIRTSRRISQKSMRIKTGSDIQGGKTSCASFCAYLIAGSRRAFLCVDCRVDCVCLSLEFEMHEVRTFAPCKTFLFDIFAFFSSPKNYFGFRTTNVKGKTDHPVSLRWNKRF